MAKIRLINDGSIAYWCPGCGCYHRVTIAPECKVRWDFNDNKDKPTLSPSVKVSGYCDDKPVNCHHFVRNGKIQYLSDCKHELAGQTVDMREVVE